MLVKVLYKLTVRVMAVKVTSNSNPSYCRLGFGLSFAVLYLGLDKF